MMQVSSGGDPAAYAWANLRRFQNVEFTTEKIIEAQQVRPDHRKNVRKQAEQIRFCLLQAREYFSAAQSVSLATKPNLLYYGTMSLALAEILFKQSGDSSLDRAREQNRHHGLTMTVSGKTQNMSLKSAASRLRAAPIAIRRGTFELWHRTSREAPIGGICARSTESGGTLDRYEILMAPYDRPYQAFPDSGMSLADCLRGLPLFMEHAHHTDLDDEFTCGFCRNFVDLQKRRSRLTMTIHPSTTNETVFERIRMPGNDIHQLKTKAVGEGLILEFVGDEENGDPKFDLPPAATINTREWRMWSSPTSLNEFGYLYVALHIAGNYARYYPDQWLQDVEASNPLSLAIEELCNIAEFRAPWLSLCELSQILYVPEV
ncbi:MAG: YaaC family protein [Afipia sp.]